MGHHVSVTRHRGLAGSALGVSGSVVLFVLLAGFVAMHGVASTTSAGVHHSGITLIAGPGHDATVRGPVADMGEPMPGAGSPDEGSGESHGLMAGCLIVLCGIAVAVALRLLRRVDIGAASRAPSWAGLVAPEPARPPPRRYRLSLCVLRV